jgi:nicotinate-nucleotide adenylyltransferase
MKTALYGGSFDPPHLGHFAIARQVLERFAVNRLVFIPASHSPLKSVTPTASDDDRLEMLRLATGDEPRFAVSDFELRKGGISYTVDTLRAWHQLEPDTELLFIAGQDSLLTLHAWREPIEIVRLCTFVTFRRPGFPLPSPEELKLPPDIARNLLAQVIDGPLFDISSSDIRERAARGESLDGLLPHPVAAYISANGLYKNPKPGTENQEPGTEN